MLVKILLVLLFIVQIHNVSSYPISRGFDAPGHTEYINWLKTGRGLPLASQGWELYQPPLYYTLAAILPNIEAARILGILAWGVIVWCAYKLAGRDAALVAATVPVGIYLTPAIGNELFCAAMISIALVYYLAGKKPEALGFLLGLAILSKATAWVLVAAIIFDLIPRWQKLVVPLAVMTLTGGWYYLRNVMVFGNPFATSVDFPVWQIHQTPGLRDLNFFFSLSTDLFRAQHSSFFSGTFFSWFFDGHNALVPVQDSSKIGTILVVISIPLFLTALRGFFLKSPRVLKIYPFLLLGAYVLYNFKLPFYSTVKGSFLTSLIVPYSYFLIAGAKKLGVLPFLPWYLAGYTLIVLKTFWILPGWYP